MNILDENDLRIQSLFDTMDVTSNKLEELFEDCIPTLNGERYITDDHLQRLLHTCDRTLQDYRNKGILPFFKFTKKIMYRESDIELMLEKAYIKAWR